MPVDDKSGQTSANCGLETGIWEIWAHNESPILDRLLAMSFAAFLPPFSALRVTFS